MGPRNFLSSFVSPGRIYAMASYNTTGAPRRRPQYPATFTVVKKYSPGPSCRNRTPSSATGASRNKTRSFAKQKHRRIMTVTAALEISARSRSSSRCSQMLMETSSGSWSSPG
eukprot:21948-Pelagococcus_subviridis.AAC.2